MFAQLCAAFAKWLRYINRIVNSYYRHKIRRIFVESQLQGSTFRTQELLAKYK